ncbi:replication terminator protein [Pseudomonas syringae pv. syringae]|nr:replication terminator protein [Pseudomonas syringae pv. syringae]
MSSINLTDFADGAVAERFNMELSKVLENIADPNTDPKKVRKVTLTISLKADDKRDIAQVGIVAKTTLVPAKDIETKIVMGQDNKGKVVGAELKSGIKGQTFVDDDGDIASDTGDKIVDFRKQGGTK